MVGAVTPREATVTRCFECSRQAEHSHHVVPRSLGGTRTVPLCTECHAAAHGLAAETWGSHRALTRAALAQRKADGRRVGTIPYGWQAGDDNRLLPMPAEQEIIAHARALRDTGRSLRSVLSAMNDAGFRSRAGTPFTLPQIFRMLKADRRPQPSTAHDFGPLFRVAP